jgi:hypothetical protein
VGEVVAHFGGGGAVHRQVQVRANQERDVQSSVDEESVFVNAAQRGEPTRLLEELPGGRLWVTVLDADLWPQRAHLFQRSKKLSFAEGPVRHHQKAQGRKRGLFTHATSPSSGLDAEP